MKELDVWFVLVHAELADVVVDSCEGPFDSEADARLFARCEVGSPYGLFRVSARAAVALTRERERGAGRQRHTITGSSQKGELNTWLGADLRRG